MSKNTIQLINTNLNALTESEKKLSKYILQNTKKAAASTSRQLAADAGVSASTVIRYIKLLGFQSFSEFKEGLKGEQADYSIDSIIRKDDPLDVLIAKSCTLNCQNIEETAAMLKPKLLGEAIAKIAEAKDIYLAGVGGSATVCEDLRYKLVKIHRRVHFYSDVNTLLTELMYISANDVFIAISYSGTTAEVNACADFAHNHHAPVISITRNDRNPLARISDVALHVPTAEDSLRLGAIYSRFSTLFITDLLYYGVARLNVTDTNKKIEQEYKADLQFAKMLENNLVKNRRK